VLDLEKSKGPSLLSGAALGAVVALAGCAGEAVVAVSLTWKAGGGVWAGLESGLLAAGLLGLLAVPAGLVAGALLSTRPVRRLGEGLGTGLGGGEAGAAVLAGALTLAVAAVGGILAGAWAATRMSPRFAAATGALAATGVLLVSLPLLSVFGQGLGAGARRLTPLGLLLHPGVVLVCLAGLAYVAVAAALPNAYAALPAAALAGLALVASGPARRALVRLFGGARGVALLLALLLACASATWRIERVGGGAQSVIQYRTPYLSLLLAAAQGAFDRDGDGFAPVLLGGDCDDGDPAVNPGASDVPGNGRDENCTGADARVYAPPPPPGGRHPPGLRPPMSVLIILVDALRPDHLGFAGYERPVSPNMDRFRAGATWFTRAYTPAPTTRFAMASLLTGLAPLRVPHRPGHGNQTTVLPAAETMAESLARLGYSRMGLTISYVIHHNKGTGQGFDPWKTPWPTEEWRKIYGKAAPITTAAAMDWLETRDGSKPYLLFAHYRCTHDPYIKHAEWDFGDRPIDRYDSALAYCDRHVGELLDAVDARAERDRTVVLLLSDHGELFGEHGLSNHGNSLFEVDTRVLLLARVPGVRVATVDVPVSLTDIMPTVLELAGGRAPPDLDGWSLLPLMGPDTASLRARWMQRPLYQYTDILRGTVRYRAASVVRWPWKLIRDLQSSKDSLYDVAADPGESDDLLGRRRDERAELGELLESWLAAGQRTTKSPPSTKTSRSVPGGTSVR